MATDATGTPTTSLGIPKYNTAADIPSGKGFNAAMDFIDDLLEARVTKPASMADNEVPVWDAATSAWIRSSDTSVRINNGGSALPKVTYGAIAAGPPASPSDGDIWIAGDVAGTDGPYGKWMFSYVAGIPDAYKWVFIGGAPAHASVDALESTASTTATDLTTVGPSLTLARAGAYRLMARAGANADTAAGYCDLYYKIAAAAAVVLVQTGNAANNTLIAQATDTNIVVAAGDTVKLQYGRTLGANAVFRNRRLSLLPLRVS